MKQQEKIQNLKSKIQNFFHRSKIFKFIFVILIFTFLFLNLISSQFISSLYFGFINNNEKITVSFLQKIKILPEYQKILEMNNNIYGNIIKREIFEQENKKKELINNLEQQLIINPNARDILYSLYQLYLTEGNKSKAEEYLRRAREVDPNIN